MPEDKYPIPVFAKRIKDKYPQYKDVDDTLLVNRIVEKYPEYKDQVDFGTPLKKKETSDNGLGGGALSAGSITPALGTLSISKPKPLNPQQKLQSENDYIASIDKDINDAIGSYQTVKVIKGDAGGRSGGNDYIRKRLTKIDINNPSQYAILADELKGADYLQDVQGKTVKKEDLLNKLNQRAMFVTSQKGVSKSLSQLDDPIEKAIVSKVMESDRGSDKKSDAVDDQQKVQHFKLGLSHLEQIDPVRFKNAVNTLARTNKVGDADYSYISSLGQQIANQQKSRGAIFDTDWKGSQTEYDYTSYGQRKARDAGKIGEYLKEKGYKNQNRFTSSQIKEAAKATGVNPTIADDLAKEEKLLFYDAIPKSGWMDDVASGIMQPIGGMKETIQSWTESPAETYLRSQRLDEGIGGQKVPDEKGQYSDVLPSERNWKTDMFRGAGQLLTQIVGSKGIGAIAKGIAGTTGATLNAAQKSGITNYLGTGVNTFLQTYGTEYKDALARTGDPKLSKLLATIDGSTSAAWEMLLPDAKIADKAYDGIKKAMSNDIEVLVKAGGNPAEIAAKSRPFIQKAVGEIATTWGKEVSEEVGTTITDFITESIFSPSSAKDRDAGKEIGETFRAAAAASLLPSILGGGMSSLSNKEFTQNTLHSAALNIEDYTSALNSARANEEITQEEYDRTIELLQRHRKNIDQAPKDLSQRKQLDTAFEKTISETSQSELSAEEQAAIEGLSKKDFTGTPIKFYTDIIQDPNASVNDKKEALKGLSDQLTAKGTEALVGEALGKEADLIYDLGYEPMQETAEMADLTGQTKPKVRVSAEQMEAAQPKKEIPDETITEADIKDQQGQQPTEETIKPDEPPIEPPKESKTETGKGGEEITLNHADTEKIYQELSLPLRADTPTKSREKLIEQALAKIKDGYDFEKVAKGVMEGEHNFDDIDQAAFAIKVTDLKNKQEGLDVTSKLFNDLQTKIEKLSRASDVAGTISARALQARVSRKNIEETISDFITTEKQARGTEELTDEQKGSVKKEYEEIKKAAQKWKEKYEALKNKQAEDRVKSSASKGKNKKTSDDFKKERQDIIQSIKDKLKKSRGETNVTVIPYVKELFAISPEIAKMVKSLVEQGVTKLSDVVDQIHDILSPEINGITKNDVKDLISGVYDQKNEPVKLDRDAKEAQDNLIKLKKQRQLKLLKLQAQRKNWWDKTKTGFTNVIGVPRALMSSFDYSAPLRQSLFATIAHPQIAGKAFLKMFEASFSQKAYDRWFDDLQNSPRYDLIQKSKLAITDPNSAELQAREEAFMSNLAERIPLIGRLVKGSNRAYSMYLNKMRVDIFNRLVDQMNAGDNKKEYTKEQYQELASFVNNMTGRGDLGKSLNDASPLLSNLFFSPRLMASRINTLTYLVQPRFYNSLPAKARADYFKGLIGTAGVGLLVLALAKGMGAETEDDPRSPDFGKIKVGNTRYDIWGGHQQYIRLIATLFSGEKKSSTSGKVRKENRADNIKTFLRGKTSPVTSLVWDMLDGKNIVGEKLTRNWYSGEKEVGVGDNLASHLLPLMITGLNDAYKDDGIKGVLTTIVPSMFGVGVQTYEQKNKK